MVELSEPAQPLPLRRAAAASRRRRILDAAAELIESRGYERTTIDEVAALAGITKRTLYRYVDSKERLLYEIHEDFLDGLLQEVTALTGSPRERFGAMISAHMADLAAHQRDIKVFFEEVKHIDAAQRELLFARRTTYASAVEGIIAEGVTSGEFEVPDVRLAVRGLLGAMNEAYRWYNPRGALSCAELSARLTDLFLFGIDATPPPAAAEISVAELDRRMAAPEAAAEADETPAERIVRCAAVLFAEHGYHATSTQEIADAAGITKGALFYHVSSKSEVLVRIHEDCAARYLDGVLAIDPTRSRSDQFTAAVVAHARTTAQHRHAVSVLSEEMKYLPPETRRRVRSQLRSVYEQVRAIVEGGQRDGEFRDTDPGVATLVVLGLINSTYRWYRHEAGFSPGVLASSLLRLVQHGIGSPGLRAETGMAGGAPVPPAPTAPARPERSSS